MTAHLDCIVTAGLVLCLVTTPAILCAQDAPPDSAPEEASGAPVGEFTFGSYGRVMAATDLQGGGGRQVNVVSFGPRLEEPSYLELDFSYRLQMDDGASIRTVITLAVVDALFHFDGGFDSAVALRNAYVEAADFGVGGLAVWAGSRMYRGDDIYLLDFWPLDNLNTVGGGARYRLPSDTTIAVHGGVNRLDDSFQYQEVTVAGPDFDTEQQILNDRVRVLGSLRVEQLLLDVTPDLSLKMVGWFEGQRMGEGVFEDENDRRIELPSDSGLAGGLQLGMWGITDGTFANVFLRYATGLSAYGELAEPTGLDLNRTTSGAWLFRAGTSFNFEHDLFGVMGGAYVQRFEDADNDRFDPDHYTEGVFALRPMLYLGEYFRQGFEVSYQTRRPDGLSQRTDTFIVPAMWKLAVMPSVALGTGTYSRPELRLVYSVSLLNDAAQQLFPNDDPRRERATQHFFGVGAEWWFNSSSYD